MIFSEKRPLDAACPFLPSTREKRKLWDIRHPPETDGTLLRRPSFGNRACPSPYATPDREDSALSGLPLLPSPPTEIEVTDKASSSMTSFSSFLPPFPCFQG